MPKGIYRFEVADAAVDLRRRVHIGATPASYSDVVNGLQDDAAFRTAFSEHLAACRFRAFRLETRPVTRKSVDQPFEFVLLDAPELLRGADPSSFARELAQSPPGATVVCLKNPSGDATLLVPTCEGAPETYAHLATFVRGAPEAQMHELWTAVGKLMEAQIGDAPLWLNTAGAGTPWLHVRVDTRPKYYRFGPYRVA